MNTLFTVIKENLTNKSFNPETDIVLTTMTEEGFLENGFYSEKMLKKIGYDKTALSKELGELTYSDYVMTEIIEKNQDLKKTYIFKKELNDTKVIIKLRTRCSCNGNRFFVELNAA